MANDDDSHISAFLLGFRRVRGLILKRFDINSKALTSLFHVVSNDDDDDDDDDDFDDDDDDAPQKARAEKEEKEKEKDR